MHKILALFTKEKCGAAALVPDHLVVVTVAGLSTLNSLVVGDDLVVLAEAVRNIAHHPALVKFQALLLHSFYALIP